MGGGEVYSSASGFNEKMKGLKFELHCHDNYSNGKLTESRFPNDCEVSPEEQLRHASKMNINFFITNHNTVESYKEYLDLQDKYEELRNVKVFRGIEYSILEEDDNDSYRPHINKVTNNNGVVDGKYFHLLVYGVPDDITEKVPTHQSFERTIRGLKKHCPGALKSIPHPYAIGSGGWDIAKHPDIDSIEVFNPNNMDVFSNLRAEKVATESKKPATVGSDSHLLKNLGKCAITIQSEDKIAEDLNVNDVMDLVKGAKFNIGKKLTYNTIDDFKDITIYHFKERQILLDDFSKRFTPIGSYIVDNLANHLEKYAQNKGWNSLGRIFQNRMKNISKKTHIYRYDDNLIKSYSLPRKIIESFLPMWQKRSVKGIDFEKADEYLKNYNFENPEIAINSYNKELREKLTVAA